MSRRSQARANTHSRWAVRGDRPTSGGGLLDRQAGEEAELHQLAPPAGGRPPAGSGRRRGGGAGRRPAGAAAASASSKSTRRRPPPCRTRPLRRAGSTRMRRMASAAAAKKCPRPSQSRGASAARPAAGTPRGPGRWLERLARPLGRHAARRRASAARRTRAGAGRRRPRVAGRGRVQEAGDIAHGLEDTCSRSRLLASIAGQYDPKTTRGWPRPNELKTFPALDPLLSDCTH